MRLTLRTLLAYLDEMLEPADAAALRERIEQNEQAGAIVERVQDVVRRLRIGAPKINDKGLAADANAVAEYLDNTMSPAKVADFERACLESDVHLAEVAACHQILSLVLREQADVDSGSRQRLYDFVERATSTAEAVSDDTPSAVEAAAATTAAAAGAAPPAGLVSTYAVVAEAAQPPSVDPRPERRRPEVPDYLREEARSQWWPMAVAALLLVALVGALYVAVAGPNLPEFLGGQPIAARNTQQPDAQPAVEPPVAPAVPAAAPSATVNPPPEATPMAPVAPGDEPASEPTESPEPEMPAEPPVAPAATADAEPVEPAAPPAAPPVPAEPAPVPVPPAAPTDEGAPAEGGQAGPVVVARVTKNDAIVLRFDRTEPAWQRLVPGEIIHNEEPLLILPVFRPAMVLESGPAVEPLGPTDFTFLPPNAEGVEGVALAYGQMRFFANGNAGAKLRIAAAGREAVVTFVDPEAVIAVDLGFWRNPGDDPTKSRAAEVFGAYAVAGRVQWTDPSGEDQASPVAGPAMLVAPTLPGGPAATDLPPWLSPEITPLIDRRAAGLIAQESFERGVVLTLKEQADRPQVEVRSLAARCLCQIGEFDAAARMLDDKELRQYWDDLTQALVSAVNRGPGDAQRVREAFALQFGAQDEAAYRMLWGYSNEQLAAGADRELVDALENDSLGIRRLALWNLNNITGATMLYLPEQTAKARQTAMQKWRAKQKRGEIRYGAAAPTSEQPAGPAPPASPAEPAPAGEGVAPGDL